MLLHQFNGLRIVEDAVRRTEFAFERVTFLARTGQLRKHRFDCIELPAFDAVIGLFFRYHDLVHFFAWPDAYNFDFDTALANQRLRDIENRCRRYIWYIDFSRQTGFERG